MKLLKVLRLCIKKVVDGRVDTWMCFVGNFKEFYNCALKYNEFKINFINLI